MFLWDQTDSSLGEECGVFGISTNEEAVASTALELHDLQYHSQETANIISHNKKHFHSDQHTTPISYDFTNKTIMERVQSQMTRDHLRYSTTSDPSFRTY